MKKIIIPILFIICICLSGCEKRSGIYANYRAIELMQVVQTLGVDEAAGGDVILSAATGKSENGDAILLSRRAPSLPQAIASLQDYAPRGELFFAHTQYIVVGQAAAESGLDGLLDFVQRDNEMRMGTKCFILRQADAKELFAEGKDITEALSSAAREMEVLGDSHVYSFRELAKGLNENGAALCGALQMVDTEESVFSDVAPKSVIPAGYAILKEDKLLGFLDSGESKAASLLTHNLGSATYTLSDGADGQIVLQFDGSRVELRPTWNTDGTPTIDIHIKAGAVIAQANTARTTLTDSTFLEKLSAELSHQMQRDILSLLDRSKDLNADFLGFGALLRRSDAEKFKALPFLYLNSIEYRVSVDASVDHNYDLSDRGEGG